MSEIIELAPGVVLVDISDELPPYRKLRRSGPITGWYFHHSGAMGKPGKVGALNSQRYVLKQKKWYRRGKLVIGFPVPSYHIWIPYNDEATADGELVAYRLAPDSNRCWHTGGKANGHGRGIVFQGNTTTQELSEIQIEIAEALIPYMAELDGLDPAGAIRMHCEADKWGGSKKAACPGLDAETWLRTYRSGA